MTHGTRAAIAVAVALGTAGCPVKLDPAQREKLGQGPPIHVFHWVPQPLARGPFGDHDLYFGVPGVEAPVAEVERAFLEAVRAEKGWSNLEPAVHPMWTEQYARYFEVSMERAAPYDPVVRLPPEWFPDGLMLEFRALEWKVRTRGLPGRCPLFLQVLARVQQLPDEKTVWAADCGVWNGKSRPGFGGPPNSLPCGDPTAEDLAHLKELRAESARACAAELVDAFMGRKR